MWFPGDHCDVGGGYEAKKPVDPDDNYYLASDIPLHWMVTEAVKCGLRVDHKKKAKYFRQLEKSHGAPLHDSLGFSAARNTFAGALGVVFCWLIEWVVPYRLSFPKPSEEKDLDLGLKINRGNYRIIDYSREDEFGLAVEQRLRSDEKYAARHRARVAAFEAAGYITSADVNVNVEETRSIKKAVGGRGGLLALASALLAVASQFFSLLIWPYTTVFKFILRGGADDTNTKSLIASRTSRRPHIGRNSRHLSQKNLDLPQNLFSEDEPPSDDGLSVFSEPPSDASDRIEPPSDTSDMGDSDWPISKSSDIDFSHTSESSGQRRRRARRSPRTAPSFTDLLSGVFDQLHPETPDRDMITELGSQPTPSAPLSALGDPVSLLDFRERPDDTKLTTAGQEGVDA